MPRKPKELSLDDKREMLVMYDTGGLRNMCENSAARILDVSKRTMKMVLAERQTIEASVAENDPLRVSQTNYRLRDTLITDMNNIMFQCFTEMIHLNLPIDDNILLDRARRVALQMDIPDFVPDMAWIECWKETRRIPAEHTYSRTRESVIAEYGKLHKDLVEYALSNYRADDVYGLVEIGLHYVTSTPAKPGAPPYSEPDYNVQTISGVYICNITGTDKRAPLVFDKSHSFNGVSPLPDSNHINFNMLKADDYKSYIRRLDKSMAPRKILLVLDNYSEHPRIQLKNIELRLLPRGTIHPLGVRIASNVRRTDGDGYGTTPLPPSAGDVSESSWEAIESVYKQLFSHAWETITPAIIRDCFRTLRFLNAEAESGTDAGAALSANEQRQTVIAHTSSAVQTFMYGQYTPSCPYNSGTDIPLQMDATNNYGNNEPLIPISVLNMDRNNPFDYGHTHISGTRGHNDSR